MSRISPILLWVIVILAVIFFLFGLLQLLLRYFIKSSSFSSLSHSNRFPESSSNSHSLHRQLQHLFRLHDSGLDQSIIDTLPMFHYKDIMGLKEPFDCAVCLCEFSEQDILRLLPFCCHAFHTHCIDTWLLSNSTCPLCRALIGSSFASGDSPRALLGSERVFSVRLGKFRGGGGDEISSNGGGGEISRCNLDARRCFSMGSYQYVVGDSDLQVAAAVSGNSRRNNINLVKVNEGKKIISARSGGESFSVSKIWLWSKKGNNVSGASLNLGVPITNTSQIV